MITSKPGEMPLDIVHDPFLHFRALQCRHRMVIEDLSRVGHAQLARRPVEEAGAERRLELLEDGSPSISACGDCRAPQSGCRNPRCGRNRGSRSGRAWHSPASMQRMTGDYNEWEVECSPVTPAARS